ncbi:MAG: hypothetical protein HYY37_01585 [Candidatus Aenigmarchaeota archaeon]|nr:hypothetical protein [Candidatus Aenigmarchaeota archaeon]
MTAEHPFFAALAGNGHVLSRDFTTVRDMTSGWLEQLVKRGIVYAITTNPTSNDMVYASEPGLREKMRTLVAGGMRDATRIYDELFINSIIVPATAILEPVNRRMMGIAYERKSRRVVLQKETRFLHGYASYEFRHVFTKDPVVKREEDVIAAIAEIMRLSHLIMEKTGRKNFFIKVPATPAGIEAGARAISMGYNINFTLVASRKQYEATVEAAVRGKRDYAAGRGAGVLGQLRAVNDAKVRAAVARHEALVGVLPEVPDPGSEIGAESVSSDFVSRTDRVLDPLLLKAGRNDLVGKAGIAYVKAAIYPVFEAYFMEDAAKHLLGETWQQFAQRTGSRIQQIYWGSTGVKDANGAYTTDPKYTGQLKAPGTTNTAPPEVIDALSSMPVEQMPFDASLTIWDNRDVAARVLEEIAGLGIDIEARLHQVYLDGLASFAKSDAATFQKIEADIVNCVT